MAQVPLYRYEIPLEETDQGQEPAYEYPDRDVLTQFEEEGSLVVIQDEVIPQFHRESIAVDWELISPDDVPLPR